MLHTTFTKLHKAGACPEGYRKLALSLGGVTKYGKDTPIPLDKIIESNRLQEIHELALRMEVSDSDIVRMAIKEFIKRKNR